MRTGRPPKHGEFSKGAKKPPLYRVWCGMKERCTKKYSPKYKYYGGKGVSICSEWAEWTAFKEWALSSGYKQGLSIERRDVNGNYEPSNCCFATPAQQTWNRTNSVRISFNGEEKPLGEWASEIGIKPRLLWGRLFRWNWSIERAFTLPVRKVKTI